jgi:hypothetical protein
MKNRRKTDSMKEVAKMPKMPRDLVDFYLHWSDFRGHAEALMQRPGLSPEEHELIGWLIKLADRIGPRDLHMS